ncbi:CopG family ribbon-helix-helix protein, partial [Desulfoferrobacter suflitae]|uniref:CopG family ribbon-helix-helix protein n=1 Tax=Desulfoferrobacter suflitae TaxID=2865782 RepID=UPI002164528D
MSKVVTIRIDEEIKERLDRLAKATARSRSFLAAEAIRNYLDVQAWQIDQILQGIEEAETGKFVEHDRVVQQWE